MNCHPCQEYKANGIDHDMSIYMRYQERLQVTRVGGWSNHNFRVFLDRLSLAGLIEHSINSFVYDVNL